MNRVTCVAPVNIAVIKYWGKKNEALIIPLNDSISTTLCTQHLCAKTSVMASAEFTEDKMWLNGREESLDNQRIRNCLSAIRRLAKEQSTDNTVPFFEHVHICSENNFPTAAGLASSAAGYACLVYTLAQLYGVSSDISGVARLGSGSACRSVFGGFVQWHKGSDENGSDSVSTQIAPASHWRELRVLILVVSDQKKTTSSTSGMQVSVATSDLLKYRVEHVLPERIARMRKVMYHCENEIYIGASIKYLSLQAILERDFTNFAEITMKDSNQFHAICLDTYPPVGYMKEASHAIAHLVHKYNAAIGQTKVAYTFDAGPNACLYMLESEVPQILGLIDWAFPPKFSATNNLKGLQVERVLPIKTFTEELKIQPWEDGSLQYMILSEVGDGPERLCGDSIHLLDEFGQPVKQQ